MQCPACRDRFAQGGTELVDRAGVLHEAACPSCEGRFLPSEVATPFLGRELGLSPGELVARTTEGRSGAAGPCPSCRREMRSVDLPQGSVGLCVACGGLWLLAGQLRALSGGRVQELIAPAPEEAERTHPGGPTQFLVFVRAPEKLEVADVAAAYGPIGGYRQADYALLLEQSRGVLGRGQTAGLSEWEASAVVASLERRGHPAEIEPIDALTVPARMRSRRIGLDPFAREDGAIIVYDQYGRADERALADLRVASLGLVDGAGGKARPKGNAILNMANASPFGWRGSGRPSNVGALERGLKTNAAASDATVVLELIFQTAPHRFQLDARGLMLPATLGAGDGASDEANLTLFSLRLAKAAPHVLWNHSATEALGQDPESRGSRITLPAHFVSRRIFERELAWTRWARDRVDAHADADADAEADGDQVHAGGSV